MTIKQVLEQCLEDEEYPWILEKLEITLMKMENQGILTAMHMDIWQETAGNQRKKKR